MVTIRISEPGLLQVDRARLRKGWLKQSEIWYLSAYTTRATLKRFWRREAIEQGTFIEICAAVGITNWESLVATSLIPDLLQLDLNAMPDVSVFFGRTAELQQLTAMSKECRIIVVWGIGGIGKTALVAEWIESLVRYSTGGAKSENAGGNQFETIIWKSIQSSCTVSELTDYLQKACNSPEKNIIDIFKRHRVLLILDNWGCLLGGGTAGQVKEEFQEFSKLLEQLRIMPHRGCVIVISSEKPAEIALSEGTNSTTQSLKLEGLGSDAIPLLEHRKLQLEPDAWNTLIQHYRGHPLALNMIAGLIKEICQGSAATFLKMNTIVVHQLDNVLAERMRHLPQMELDILKILARQPQSISHERLHEQLPQYSQSQLLEILLSLERRSLLEILSEPVVLFTLAPIIKKYICQKIIK